MSKLSEIEARDAWSCGFNDRTPSVEDRRYLLGLLAKAVAALERVADDPSCAHSYRSRQTLKEIRG